MRINIKMDFVEDIPYDYTTSFRPKRVGVVGDPTAYIKLKTSTPYLPDRRALWTVKQSFGSNVQDGDANNSSGGNARVIFKKFGHKDGFRIRDGWNFHSIVPPDKKLTVVDCSLQNFTWKNKVATNYEAARTGNKFLPPSGGFSLPNGELPRGNGPKVMKIGRKRGGILGQLIEAKRGLMGSAPVAPARAARVRPARVAPAVNNV